MVGYLGLRLVVDFMKPYPAVFLGLGVLQWACVLTLAYYARDVWRWVRPSSQGPGRTRPSPRIGAPDRIPMTNTSAATSPLALTGTDRQVLIALRIALAVYIVLSFGSMLYSLVTFGRYSAAVSVQLILRNILATVPFVAVLLAVIVRTPPAALALDAAAGLGIASVLYRVGFLAFSGMFVSASGQLPALMILLLRLAAFTALEVAIVGMAIYLRGRVGALNPVALIVATAACLLWGGLVQAVMQAVSMLLY